MSSTSTVFFSPCCTSFFLQYFHRSAPVLVPRLWAHTCAASPLSCTVVCGSFGLATACARLQSVLPNLPASLYARVPATSRHNTLVSFWPLFLFVFLFVFLRHRRMHHRRTQLWQQRSMYQRYQFIHMCVQCWVQWVWLTWNLSR